MFRPKVRLCLGTLSLTALLLASCDRPLLTPRPTADPAVTAIVSPLPATDAPTIPPDVTEAAPTAPAATPTLNAPPAAGEPPPGATSPLPTSSGPPAPPPPPPGS